MCPLVVSAKPLEELPPRVKIVGMDLDEYNVDKTITDKEVIVTIQKKNDKVEYSWTFDKEKVGSSIELNFEMNHISPKKEEIDALADNNDKLYLSFAHHGTLPSEATIRTYVGDKYQEGERLYLYYYDEENKEIEYIDSGLRVENGYVTFRIDHCSEYFLTGTIVKDAVNNPKSMNYIIVVLVIVIFGLVGITMFSSKK